MASHSGLRGLDGLRTLHPSMEQQQKQQQQQQQQEREHERPCAKIELDFGYYASLADSAIMDAFGCFIGIAEPKWSPKALFQARAELPIDAQDAPRHFNNPLFDEVGGDKEAKWVVDLDPVWSRITRATSRSSPKGRPDTPASQPVEQPSSPPPSPRSSAVLQNSIFTATGAVNWSAFLEVD